MAKIVAISGTEELTPQKLSGPILVGWALVLGVTGWIFWKVVGPDKRRRS